MKRFSSLMALAIFLSAIAACTPQSSDSKANTSDVEKGIRIANGAGPEFFTWSPDRVPLISAHRGGPYPGYPENAIATFQHISDQIPTIIECDIAMTKDSVLVMMHDYTLDRTTTGEGKVMEVTYDELEKMKLVDNEGSTTTLDIPTLDDVLKWADGRAVLTLDVKRGVPFEKVVAAVQDHNAQDYAAIITYNARDAAKVNQLDGSLMISVGIGSQEAYEAHSNLGVPDNRMIAFVGVSEPEASLYEFLHNKGIYCILGVLGNLDRKAIAQGDSTYLGYIQRGADILATDRPLEAFEAIQPLIKTTSTKQEYFYGY
ncbi:MAG: glycerophosphodiester phosphodiesterase family protein [Roseivirga sp.]|jgi:glycerophosphoryl diester phosphodiesterase|uniref:glycerophosphodiester phosphodiesterase family protein n=1 Tax=Roseivirga sp. TaxID=1964215 RepID=UPI001B04E0E8|nr:glycerophosphodiester phosphodiesterase family protein [Roseivirga sp.]MBO6497323.1 glycerophosphodiester phosphodiesterase family protein [Roseivirga sp.]